MAGFYRISFGDSFIFEGSKGDFASHIRNKLIKDGYDLTPQMLDAAEQYAEYFLFFLIDKVGRRSVTNSVAQITLDADEFMLRKRKTHMHRNGRYDRLFLDFEYNINIKSTSLTLIALLLDLSITDGIASVVLALFGVNSQSLVHISSYTGERCVLMELCREREKMTGANFFKNICGSECVNNNLDCKFRGGDKCRITQDEVIAVLESLADKNVVSKTGATFTYNP